MKPSININPQKWMLIPEVSFIFETLNPTKFSTRYVGGCVRNLVLGSNTELDIIDIDLATINKPEKVVNLLTDKGIKVLKKDMKYGTVTAIKGSYRIQVTTLRKDVNTDGRYPDVEYTEDWLLDANRRDFTINAIYADSDGTIYDPKGGIKDLEIGLIRFIGIPDLRVKEDRLRILRFFRFLSLYSKRPPDKQSLEACINASNELEKISKERIKEELFKILVGPNVVPSLGSMVECGILQTILPQATRPEVLQMLCELEYSAGLKPEPLTRLSSLINLPSSDENAKLLVKSLNRSLKLSGTESEQILSLLSPTMMIKPDFKEELIRQYLYFYGYNLFVKVLFISWARLGTEYDFRNIIETATNWQIPVFPIKGKDLQNLGLLKSRDLGNILQETEHWWVNNNFSANKNNCLEYIRSKYLEK